MKHIIIILLLGLMGCYITHEWEPADNHHYNVQIDSTLTPEQKEQVVSAINEWQSQSGNYFTFGYDDSTDAVISIHTMSAQELHFKFEMAAAFGATVFNGQSSDIYIVPTTNLKLFRQTALHEIGHSMGANHIGFGNIMCSNDACASENVECPDLIEICSHNSCDAATMPRCIP